MSHIDSYEHEFIGFLGSLPIYHPLQEIPGPGWGHADFGASPANLVLGGGPGEHPGLVLHRLECLAATYVNSRLAERELDALSHADRAWLAELIAVDAGTLLEYCAWDPEDHAAFAKMACSPALRTPLTDEPVATWLLHSIGELLIHALPDLYSAHARLATLASPFRVRPVYGNVLCPPPPYPPDRGRTSESGNQRCHHRWSTS